MSASTTEGSGTDDGTASSRCPTPDPDILANYNELMTSLIPLSAPMQSQPEKRPIDEDEHGNEGEGNRPMTKAEKQNAKKKRRKERDKEEKAAAERQEREKNEMEEMAKPVEESRAEKLIIAFRLFSSCPLKDISLLPSAEDYDIPPNPRHIPLPQALIERIRDKASEAAVRVEPTVQTSFPPPSMLLATSHRGHHKPLRAYRARSTPQCCILTRQAIPAKAAKTQVAIPRITVEPITNEKKPKRQRTKRPNRQVVQ